jgi:hypothetical protein
MLCAKAIGNVLTLPGSWTSMPERRALETLLSAAIEDLLVRAMVGKTWQSGCGTLLQAELGVGG